MVLDVLTELMNFLCPTSNSLSSCQSFVQQPYHQVLQPLGPLLYFFFFPTVIILIFIYILSNAILKGGGLTTGLRLLIAVAVYVFIIINGLYPVFLWLSDIWFIVAVILFGFWYFVKGHFGGGGGGGGGKMPSVGIGGGTNLASQVFTRVKKEVKGEIRDLENEIRMKLEELEAVREATRKDPSAWRGYPDLSAAAWTVLKRYDEELKIGGITVGGKGAELKARLEKIIKETDRNYGKSMGKAA